MLAPLLALSSALFYFLGIASAEENPNVVVTEAYSPTQTAVPAACQQTTALPSASCWDQLPVQDFLVGFQPHCNPAAESKSKLAICECRPNQPWADCFMGEAEYGATGTTGSFPITCSTLSDTDNHCVAPGFNTPLSAAEARLYYSGVAIKEFHEYAKAWYLALQASTSKKGIQDFLLKYPYLATNRFGILGGLISHYAVGNTIDEDFGKNITYIGQLLPPATVTVTSKPNDTMALQQELAAQLNQTYASMLSNWTDYTFLNFSAHGRLLDEAQIGYEYRVNQLEQGTP